MAILRLVLLLFMTSSVPKASFSNIKRDLHYLFLRNINPALHIFPFPVNNSSRAKFSRDLNAHVYRVRKLLRDTNIYISMFIFALK